MAKTSHTDPGGDGGVECAASCVASYRWARSQGERFHDDDDNGNDAMAVQLQEQPQQPAATKSAMLSSDAFDEYMGSWRV